MKWPYQPIFCLFFFAMDTLNTEIVSSSPCSLCFCKHDFYPALAINASIIDCSRVGLLEIPNTLDINTQVLILNDNRIKLKKDQNLPYKNLLALEMRNNDIGFLPSKAFYGLENLKILDIMTTQNIVSYLDDSALHGLSNLHTLKLAVSKIKENQFLNSSLDRLRYLSLEVENHILPDTMLAGLSLEEFHLIANVIQELPSKLLSVMKQTTVEKNLQIVTIASQSLRRVPGKLLTNFLASLHTFHLSTTYISVLPDGLFEAPVTEEEEQSGDAVDCPWYFFPCHKPGEIKPNMKEIKLSGVNTLSDHAFAELSMLQRLSIHGIQHLSMHVFAGLYDLSNLTLQDCRLTEIDNAQFQNLRSLKFLKISSCQITHLNEYLLEHNHNLKTLDLSYNQIHYIQDSAFYYLDFELEYLDMSHNQLSVLNETTFELDELTKLDLSFNNIAQIHPKAFQYLNDLHVLKLSHNQIKQLPDGLFDDLVSLMWIDLQFNQIEEFSQEHLYSVLSLAELNLDYNNIKYVNFSSYPNVHVSIIGNPVGDKSPSSTTFSDLEEIINGDEKNNKDQVQDILNSQGLLSLPVDMTDELFMKFVSPNDRPTTTPVDAVETSTSSVEQQREAQMDGSKYTESHGRGRMMWIPPTVGVFCVLLIITVVSSLAVYVWKKRRRSYNLVHEMRKFQQQPTDQMDIQDV